MAKKKPLNIRGTKIKPNRKKPKANETYAEKRKRLIRERKKRLGR